MHDNPTSNVQFANVVTYVVNNLNQHGHTSDLESEGVLSSTTIEICAQVREQWLQYIQET